MGGVFGRNVLWAIQQHSNGVNIHNTVKVSVIYFIGFNIDIWPPPADMLSPYSAERIFSVQFRKGEVLLFRGLNSYSMSMKGKA